MARPWLPSQTENQKQDMTCCLAFWLVRNFPGYLHSTSQRKVSNIPVVKKSRKYLPLTGSAGIGGGIPSTYSNLFYSHKLNVNLTHALTREGFGNCF